MEAGGLFICGTERHESRRIDNQLRGRSGRQGDPGESRFFLSAEDDLVRLFAGDRIYKILDRLGTVDDEGNEEPIEAGILSKQIEKAQRRVEEQNFLIRKRVLEYDDVMNEQRRVVYAYRDEILEGRDMGGSGARRDRAGDRPHGRRLHRLGLRRGLGHRRPGDRAAGRLPRRHRRRRGGLGAQPDRNELTDSLTAEAIALYDRREAELGDELMRALERYLLLQIIDQRWREHLYDMDYLREGIHLRGFAQIDPLVAYKNEAFELFRDLMNTDLVGLRAHDLPRRGRGRGRQRQRRRASTTRRRAPAARARSPTRAARATPSPARWPRPPRARAWATPRPATPRSQALPVVEQRRVDENEQIGRNDPCWCGSGKKFKKCHGHQHATGLSGR